MGLPKSTLLDWSSLVNPVLFQVFQFCTSDRITIHPRINQILNDFHANILITRVRLLLFEANAPKVFNRLCECSKRTVLLTVSGT